MTETITYDEDEIEAFKELGNVGAGHAAIALSKLFSREVGMSIPFVRVQKIKEIIEELELKDGDKIGNVFVEVTNPIKYRLSVIFKEQVIVDLLNILTSSSRKVIGDEGLSEMHSSLIQEVGSIILLRYIAALNKMLSVESMPDIAPKFEYIPAMSSLSQLVYSEDDNIMLIQLDLFTEGEKFECNMFIHPNPEDRQTYRDAFLL